MPLELCPKCGTSRNMNVTTARREVVDFHGNTKTVLTEAYHCESCHSFVRSRDIEESKGNHGHDPT